MIDWNVLIKPRGFEKVIAKKDDLVINIGGIVFLVQKQNANTCYCFRLNKGQISLKESLKHFLRYSRNQGINELRFTCSERIKQIFEKMGLMSIEVEQSSNFLLKLN